MINSRLRQVRAWAIRPEVGSTVELSTFRARRFHASAWTGVAAGVLVLALAGAAFVAPYRGDGPGLGASVQTDLDVDHDGLHAHQEALLGTSSSNPDTDGDGFKDGEELARLSSPFLAAATPLAGDVVRLGAAAYSEGSRVHISLALYAADGQPRRKNLTLGWAANGQMGTLPLSAFGNRTAVRYVPSANGGMTAVLDLWVPGSVIASHQRFSIWATAGQPGTTAVQSATQVRFATIGGKICWLRPDPLDPQNAYPITAQMAQTTPGAGSIYTPLPVSGGASAVGWIPNETCLQRTQVVGTSGSFVTLEVVAADCVEGFAAFCPPHCANFVGTTTQELDPLVLIGG
ncbi:MAG: thrombospondin type 3 repeat-containing protein [Planctomycetia bacterium]|jgi:hypothetical protein